MNRRAKELRHRRQLAPLLSTPALTYCPFCGARCANAIDTARHLTKKHDKRLCVCDELDNDRATLNEKIWALAEHLHQTGDAEAHLNYHLLGNVDGNWVKHYDTVMAPHSVTRVQMPFGTGPTSIVLRNDSSAHVHTVVFVNVEANEYRVEQQEI